MISFFKVYIITLIVFFVIDMTWLAFIAKNIYKKYLGYIMRAKPNMLAALVFYMVFIVGLVFFVIHPALEVDSWTNALFVGMLFGFITYSTYDLTNLATLDKWPLKITIIDLIWGTSLGGIVSTISFFAVKLINHL